MLYSHTYNCESFRLRRSEDRALAEYAGVLQFFVLWSGTSEVLKSASVENYLATGCTANKMHWDALYTRVTYR